MYAILAIGAFGGVFLLIMLQQALEKGYRIQPLVELKQDVQRSNNVSDVRTYREKEETSVGVGQEESERYWIVTQFRPRSRSTDDEVMSRAILKQVQQWYRGDLEPVIGYRVKCLEPKRKADRVKVIVQNRRGPGPVQVIRPSDPGK